MVTEPTASQSTSSEASTPDTGGIPQMRGAIGRHALAEDVELVTSPEAGQDTGPEPLSRESAEFLKLADDLPVRHVQWLLANGMTWPWVLEAATTPAARNRAIRRGFVAPPVSGPDGPLLPYHLTDAGRADLLNWVTRVKPHRGEPEVDALWAVVTSK
jgi:hypothetical protein